MKAHLGTFAALLLAGAMPAHAADAPLRPDQTAFRAIYKELIETDTSITTGDCTVLAGKVERMLRAGGYTDAQITRFGVADHPKEGGIVAVLPGADPSLRAILLLGHLDVVTAKRADWVRDPYQLIEEGGYYYGRGTMDMKDMDAVWIDTLIRLKAAAHPPKRTIKMALTCGEETGGAFNGADYLAQNRHDLIDAEFALNEGGGGETDGKGTQDGGHVVVQMVEAAQKTYQDYSFTATNPGGHSSIPIRDNAIYQLADALAKLRAYEFPAEMSDVTRAFFARAGKARGGEMGAAMQALAANPVDSEAFRKAEALVNTDREMHSMLRTTCVATMVEGGHAKNALPQSVQANVNCRIFPGHGPEEIQATLEKAVGDPGVKVALVEPVRHAGPALPLDPKVVAVMEKLSAKYFPGVPVVPEMDTGASDGIYLEAVGIKTYGAPGPWANPDLNGIHGLNEHMEVRSLMVGRDYLHDLVKALAE